MDQEHHGAVVTGEVLIAFGILGVIGAIAFGLFFRVEPSEPAPSATPSATTSLSASA